jgi:hypothetical protein
MLRSILTWWRAPSSRPKLDILDVLRRPDEGAPRRLT